MRVHTDPDPGGSPSQVAVELRDDRFLGTDRDLPCPGVFDQGQLAAVPGYHLARDCQPAKDCARSQHNDVEHAIVHGGRRDEVDAGRQLPRIGKEHTAHLAGLGKAVVELEPHPAPRSGHEPDSGFAVCQPAHPPLQVIAGSRDHFRIQSNSTHHQEIAGGPDTRMGVVQFHPAHVDPAFIAVQGGLDASGKIIDRHAQVPGQEVAGAEGKQPHCSPGMGQCPRDLPDGAVPAGGQYDVGSRSQRFLRLVEAGRVHGCFQNQRRFPASHLACRLQRRASLGRLGLDGVDDHRHALVCCGNGTRDAPGSHVPAVPAGRYLPRGNGRDCCGGQQQDYGYFSGHGGFRIAGVQRAGRTQCFRYS